MLQFDHIAVLGETLAEAVAHVEASLGLPMGPGGAHARFASHNQLLGLDPHLYLEAIAVDPAAPPPADARWFGLDAFSGPPRLDKWICRVADIETALDALPIAGRPVHVSRGGLSWTISVPHDGLLPFDGLFPALIEWHGAVPPGKALPAEATLRSLQISHPQAPGLQKLLAPHLQEPLIRFVSGLAGISAEIAVADRLICLR